MYIYKANKYATLHMHTPQEASFPLFLLDHVVPNLHCHADNLSTCLQDTTGPDHPTHTPLYHRQDTCIVKDLNNHNAGAPKYWKLQTKTT